MRISDWSSDVCSSDLEDLSAHQCSAYAYGDVPARWTIDGRERVAAGAFRSDSSEAVHRAALSGLGIALLPAVRVRDDIAAGRLAPVLPEDRKSTRLKSRPSCAPRLPSFACKKKIKTRTHTTHN